MTLRAPFPWFGGKSLAAPLVWELLGDVTSYVEPFAGSAAVLLARPPGNARRVETINDMDGLLVNAWRAIRWAPSEVAWWADWPVSEHDLEARHWWLVQRKEEIQRAVSTDPEWFDAKAAGWWIWGHCCWIGSGFCSGTGPWSVEGGEWRRQGQGVHRQLPHLGNAGRGVNRQLPNVGDAGRGGAIEAWMQALATRLEAVRITAGDWKRVVTPSVLNPLRNGQIGVFLDPPYPDSKMDYAGGGAEVYEEVLAWAEAAPPSYRIVVCGYAGMWTPPASWTEHAWRSRAGYGRASGRGRTEERLWASPACTAGRGEADGHQLGLLEVP